MVTKILAVIFAVTTVGYGLYLTIREPDPVYFAAYSTGCVTAELNTRYLFNAVDSKSRSNENVGPCGIYSYVNGKRILVSGPSPISGLLGEKFASYQPLSDT